jgi:hypothetical protein
VISWNGRKSEFGWTSRELSECADTRRDNLSLNVEEDSLEARRREIRKSQMVTGIFNFEPDILRNSEERQNSY